MKISNYKIWFCTLKEHTIFFISILECAFTLKDNPSSMVIFLQYGYKNEDWKDNPSHYTGQVWILQLSHEKHDSFHGKDNSLTHLVDILVFIDIYLGHHIKWGSKDISQDSFLSLHQVINHNLHKWLEY